MNLLGISLLLMTITSCSFKTETYIIDDGKIICKNKDNKVYTDCTHQVYGKISEVENAVNVMVKIKE